jgi:hypothetical protein
MTLTERAKKVSSAIIEVCQSPAAWLVPQEVRGLLLEIAALLIELSTRVQQLEETKK